MNPRIKNDSLSATHLFQKSSQWIMQSMLWTWKMNKFHAFFKVTVFCFYPARMTQVLSWSPAPSSGLSFQNRPIFMNKPYYENKFKKKAWSCQFYVEINANGYYPLRSFIGFSTASDWKQTSQPSASKRRTKFVWS